MTLRHQLKVLSKNYVTNIFNETILLKEIRNNIYINVGANVSKVQFFRQFWSRESLGILHTDFVFIGLLLKQDSIGVCTVSTNC